MDMRYFFKKGRYTGIKGILMKHLVDMGYFFQKSGVRGIKGMARFNEQRLHS